MVRIQNEYRRIPLCKNPGRIWETQGTGYMGYESLSASLAGL